MKKIILLIYLFLMFGIIVPVVTAEEDVNTIIQNLIIEIDGTNVLRSGHQIIIRPIIINNNSESSVIINKIEFLDNNQKIKNGLNLNFNIHPIKKELIETREIFLQKNSSPKTTQRIRELEFMIYQGIFARGFKLNISDFDPTIGIGDTLIIPIRIEFSYNGEIFVTMKEYSVLISEPLSSPPHNSPGWYAGDQHVHSEYSNNLVDGFNIPSISDMIDEAEIEDLEWLIFTDHSEVVSSSDWTTANGECNNKDTGSFECVYGQELALNSPGFCDRRHYLAYDSTPSYIDATCGIFPYCYCQDAEDLIDELYTNGGYGFAAHPHTTSGLWGLFVPDWEDWSVTGFTGLEIINGNWNGDDGTTINNPGGDDDSWREFLQSETNPDNGFIVSIANSDAHSLAALGDTFTYCYLDSLSQANVVNAIKDGHCIASTGPFVEFTLDGNIIGSVINAMSGTNTLEISASSTAEFGDLEWLYIYVDESIEDIISLSGTSYSDSVDINLDASNEYIRLEIYTDTGRRAYTNPIWVNVTTCSCGSWSVGSCGTGGCSSEQKPWTRTCSPYECAAQTQCVYDSGCEEGNGELSDCNESGYEFCWKYEYENCDVSIAVNMYENINNIQWGAVNDAWDPYVLGSYTFGWKDVDAEQMYYGDDIEDTCEYGGCDSGSEVNGEDTMVTTTAPNTADRETILGYKDTAEWACWVWNPEFTSFYPNYGGTPIYVLNCFGDNDCSANQYCDKSSSWSNWGCVNDKSNGQSCTSDSQCLSGYCDNDGVGLGDDGWCFTPYDTYFDGQETSYCEYSTGYGNLNCDERQTGSDLNLCVGTSYYEEECSNSCQYQDINSVFECSEAGCSCDEFLCDGLTTGNNITTCSSNQTYFADKCTSTAGGEDRGDNICRNSTFALGCTADPECEGIVAGTGNCNSSCNFILPDTHKFYVRNATDGAVAWLGNEGNIVLKGKCYSGVSCDNPGDNSFIVKNSTNNIVAFINSTGDLCVEVGDCSDQSISCNPAGNAFIIRNSTGTNMSYIDFSGNLCLTGRLFENSQP